jgi:hypothetical protein
VTVEVIQAEFPELNTTKTFTHGIFNFSNDLVNTIPRSPSIAQVTIWASLASWILDSYHALLLEQTNFVKGIETLKAGELSCSASSDGWR